MPIVRGQRCLQLASGFYEWHVDPHAYPVSLRVNSPQNDDQSIEPVSDAASR